jgi:TonB family protein
VSIVFDARKRAERSKLAREAIAGNSQLPELGPPSSDTVDTVPTNESERGTDIKRRTVAQQGPIVRSLLRMRHSEPLSAALNASKPVPQTGKIESATLILPEDPIYPAMAKLRLISGSVEVHFRISREGKVNEVKSVQGSPILAQAAVEAVKTWSCEPARLNGTPIESQASTNFEFKLS